MFVQNEFILLVNAYYQAVGLSNNIKSSGMFGEIELLPEISQFRDIVSQFDILGQTIKAGEQQGQKGEIEKMLIKAKLAEIYRVNNSFTSEIENSVSKYCVDTSDMTSYRISFQMSSDTLYNMVGSIIPHFGNHVPLRDGVLGIVNDILNKDYWEGDETKQQINFVRAFKKNLYYSDNWILEYALKIFEK